MKVQWNYFAQRRKINLEMFKEYSYEQYVDWCEERSVEPASKESFDATRAMVSEQPVTPPSKSPLFDDKSLKKLRKTALVKLCKENKVLPKGDSTKSELIRLLLSLNNID